MSGAAMCNLAADLEAAADRALKAGVSESDVVIMLAKFIGYSVANDCPSMERTMAGVRLAVNVIGLTAGEVFGKSGRIHQTAGHA